MELIGEIFNRLNIWLWWSLAGLLLIAELLTGTTYILWPAAAALIVGGLSLDAIGLHWGYQLAVFGVLTLILLYVGDRYVKPHLKSTGGPVLNDRTHGMIGQSARVSKAFENGQGRVVVGDSGWPARSESGENYQEGQAVIITALDSTVLIVRAA